MKMLLLDVHPTLCIPETALNRREQLHCISTDAASPGRRSDFACLICSAGFDINQFASGGALDDRVNDAFCELLESGPKPSVAAIEVRATPASPPLERTHGQALGSILRKAVMAWTACTLTQRTSREEAPQTLPNSILH